MALYKVQSAFELGITAGASRHLENISEVFHASELAKSTACKASDRIDKAPCIRLLQAVNEWKKGGRGRSIRWSGR